jgi:osmotically-inducible protein OsmY
MADRYSERGGGRWDDERRAHWEARGRERDYRRDDRGFFDRAGDEVRSWLGDEEAQRRRMQDEREDWRGEHRASDVGSRGDWGRARGEWTREPDQRDWSRQWGYVEGHGGGRDIGSRGWGEGFSGYGSWGRERDWGRGESVGRGDYGRGEYGRADWGGQGAGGFGTPWSSGRGEWARGDRDWGRYAGLGQQPRESEMSRGPHAGRGPRNYQRSDERIREDVCERLCQHGLIDASDIDVRVQNGEVTMEGSVNDRWAKRTAEDVAENVFGVKEVHNQIRVTQSAFGQDQENREQPNRGAQQRGPWAA